MSPTEFKAMLKAENFGEIVNVDRPVGYAMGEHQHPFEACALVTAGDITLLIAGVSTRYAAGDIFRLAAATPHEESVGASGVSYLAGRRLVSAS